VVNKIGVGGTGTLTFRKRRKRACSVMFSVRGPVPLTGMFAQTKDWILYFTEHSPFIFRRMLWLYKNKYILQIYGCYAIEFL